MAPMCLYALLGMSGPAPDESADDVLGISSQTRMRATELDLTDAQIHDVP